MTGMARSAFKGISQESKKSWTNLIEALVKVFNVTNSNIGRTMRQRFSQCTQEQDESVGEFAFKVEKIAARAFKPKSTWYISTQAMVTDQLWLGLPEKLRNMLSMSEYQDFKEIKDKAVITELLCGKGPTSITVAENHVDRKSFQQV